jgi:hypothetical protein
MTKVAMLVITMQVCLSFISASMMVITTQCSTLLVLASAGHTGESGGLSTYLKLAFNLLSLIMYPLVYQVSYI